MFYLGIDISKATFDASLLINGKHKNKKFENTDEGFRGLQNWLQRFGAQPDCWVCMEGTGKLWEPLAEYLYEKQYRVSVVNPMRIKGYAKSELRRSKTDALDAELIARFCKAQEPSTWIPKSAEMKAIRDRQRYMSELKENRTQELCRLKAGRIDPAVEARIRKHVEYIESQIKDIEREIGEIVSDNSSIQQDVTLLQSIVGIGEQTAITFLSELPSMNYFENSRALETFCGLTPRRFESGTSVRGRNRISKVGNPRIRTALYFPALAAIRANPTLREFVQRMRLAKRPGKVIVCAIMRKLVRLMFAILKSRKPYDASYVSMPVA